MYIGFCLFKTQAYLLFVRALGTKGKIILLKSADGKGKIKINDSKLKMRSVLRPNRPLNQISWTTR